MERAADECYAGKVSRGCTVLRPLARGIASVGEDASGKARHSSIEYPSGVTRLAENEVNAMLRS